MVAAFSTSTTKACRSSGDGRPPASRPPPRAGTRARTGAGPGRSARRGSAACPPRRAVERQGVARQQLVALRPPRRAPHAVENQPSDPLRPGDGGSPWRSTRRYGCRRDRPAPLSGPRSPPAGRARDQAIVGSSWLTGSLSPLPGVSGAISRRPARQGADQPPTSWREDPGEACRTTNGAAARPPVPGRGRAGGTVVDLSAAAVDEAPPDRRRACVAAGVHGNDRNRRRGPTGSGSGWTMTAPIPHAADSVAIVQEHCLASKDNYASMPIGAGPSKSRSATVPGDRRARGLRFSRRPPGLPALTRQRPAGRRQASSTRRIVGYGDRSTSKRRAL